MKGIALCAECADYDKRKHCCRRGASREDDPRNPFYDDCPLPEVALVVHGRWISVEEELPKELQTVIIYNGDVDAACYAYGYFETIDQYETNVIDGVTHWMPLPEPPEA